ncbi:MAG TPA: N-acetylglucosamine-6-phosphate deacetylase [Candidatus Nanopelagicales bacterium]|nr:N-acetylglucosamine-6-phosphate deacetylase [Candidatus Nanopelagicales bacterium]
MNVHVVSAPALVIDGVLSGPGAVEITAGRISAVLDRVPAPGPEHTALPDGVLSAGLVDLQVNGFAGYDLADADPVGWEAVRRALPSTGVTSFLATFITAPVAEQAAAMTRGAAAASRPDGARLLGVHLEGPFLSAQQQGAHDPSLLLDPDPASVALLLEHDLLALVTLAPERAGADAAIAALTDRGVVVSLGHSDADATQALAGVDAGARMVTHLFNAMRPLHHRDPGLVGVALSDDRLTLGLICDLHHVAERVCTLVLRAAPGRVALVTDAVAATTMPPGRYDLGGEVLVVDAPGGLPRRLDGTIAGSTLTLDRAVRNAVGCGLAPAAAIAAASRVPARLLGRDDVGDLTVGAHADLVWWSPDLQVRRSWLGGSALD